MIDWLGPIIEEYYAGSEGIGATMISSEEWLGIEVGLVQRAELFNLILKDLYGPQTLIKNGLLPNLPEKKPG